MGNCLKRCFGWLCCQLSIKYPAKLNANLYCHRNDNLTNALADELRTTLKHELDKLNVNIYHDATKLSEKAPTIVMCINSSRLGTDVSTATKELTLSPMHAVVVLSHRDPSDSNPGPSSRQLVDPKFKPLYYMLDMRFRADQGVRLYQCGMNTRAVNDMIRFIKANN